jgi:hypothetical protein
MQKLFYSRADNEYSFVVTPDDSNVFCYSCKKMIPIGSSVIVQSTVHGMCMCQNIFCYRCMKKIHCNNFIDECKIAIITLDIPSASILVSPISSMDLRDGESLVWWRNDHKSEGQDRNYCKYACLDPLNDDSTNNRVNVQLDLKDDKLYLPELKKLLEEIREAKPIIESNCLIEDKSNGQTGI